MKDNIWWFSFKDHPPKHGEMIEIHFSNDYRESKEYDSEVDYNGTKVYPTFWRYK